jgi:hypothetical protein
MLAAEAAGQRDSQAPGNDFQGQHAKVDGIVFAFPLKRFAEARQVT